MKIIIETIPHETQRYPTIGDWFYDPDGTLHIKVSKLSDDRLEQLIAVHELVEVLLCKHDGVTQKQVDDFDFEFEKQRASDDVESEAGDDSMAPYRRQHSMATAVERMMAAWMNVDWNAYADEIEGMPEVEPKQ